MGLFSKVLLLPLAPVAAVVWTAERLEALARAEMDDPDKIRRELAKLQEAFESGDIDETELALTEDALLQRLEELNGATE
jgi:hypothetical protein